MVTFSGWDWLVAALFISGVLALGFSAKLRDHSALEFLVAGRRLTLPAMVVTLVSTWYGGILGVGETVAWFGLGAFLLIGIPYYAFAVIYAFVLARRVREVDQISLPERLSRRFGTLPGFVGAGLLFLLALPAAHVLMLGTLVQAFTGWALAASVVIAAVFGFIFLYRGGLLADARVSFLAFTLMYVGFAVALAVAVFGGGVDWQAPAAEAPELASFTGGVDFLTIVGFFLLGAWTLVDPGFHQRVASARSPEISRRGVLVSVGCWMLFDALSISTAWAAISVVGGVPENPLLLYPLLAEALLPDGLKAVFIVGMTGTILSAFIGYLLVAGGALGRDLWSRGASGEGATRATRVGLVIAVILAVGLALQIGSVVELWYAWGGCVVGALLIPVMVAYRRETGDLGGPWVVAGSMAMAALVSVSLLIYGQRTGNPFLTVTLGNGWEFSLGTLVPGLLVSAAILGLAAVARKFNHAR